MNRLAGELRLGIDLGAVSAKLLLLGPDGRVLHRDQQPCRGRSGQALETLLERLGQEFSDSTSLRAALTGSAGTQAARKLPLSAINEIIAAAEGAQECLPAARAVIDLGGQSSRFMLLADGEDGPVQVQDFATNGLCAAGSGAFLQQQAERMRLSVKELSVLAQGAERGASIAGRCSVFAKSDMIHLQQKGTPEDEIAYGLCLALARTFVTSVIGGREIERPLVLTGGGAENAGLVRAFREILALGEDELLIPEHPAFTGAMGAARLAGSPPLTLADLRKALRRLGDTSLREGSAAKLLALDASCMESNALPEQPPVGLSERLEVFVGLDVGSVSTNLVLLSKELELLHGIYLKTRGRPVDVLDECLTEIRERFGESINVLGVGSTGSGRHLAERVIGADVVHNEITAQMVSAAHYVPEVDTIFEIGGQDSKFISVEGGQLADFEMNKICAAGTGSFLEEQAGRLGLSIIGEFAGKALAGSSPADLGTRCTVFMDTELVLAQGRGVRVEDLCAGLAYSVARNYLDKVVAGRRIGRHIVFQGGTASNAAVVAAFARILDRPVHVHPYNRLSGALGAAILAQRSLDAQPRESVFRGLQACADATIDSFECRACENLCQVNRVRAGGRVVHFGDSCERYSEKDRAIESGPRPFPELFRARRETQDALVAEACRPEDGTRPRMGLLQAGLNLEHLPFWTAFLSRLGYEPVLAEKTSTRLMRQHTPKVPGELCLPMKAASSQAQALLEGGEVERVFVPCVMDYLQEDGSSSSACLYNQQLADMLRTSHGDRIATAQFGFRNGMAGLLEPTLALRGGLDRSADQILLALRAAQDAQACFDQKRLESGRDALAADFDYAIVVLGKPYNTHDPFLNLGLARLLDQLGMPAIPWDLLPLDEIELDERWITLPWRYSRQQLRALEVIRRDKRLFPVLVSSYGCGPDAFTVKHIEEMLSGTPRLLLEFDEHRGEAGLQTRLEAFRDEIEVFLASGRRTAPALRTPGCRIPPEGRRFHIPSIGPHSRIFAAILRAGGYEAEILPEVSEETMSLGEAHSSGRECHPHTIIVGEFCRFAEQGKLRDGDIFLAPIADTPCLIRQYGDSIRVVAQRAGYDIEIYDGTMQNIRTLVGTTNILHLYEGLLAADILITLSVRLAPYVRDREGFEARTRDGFEEIALSLEAGKCPTAPLERVVGDLWHAPRDGNPGDRPVVGVTGDLYTRIHPVGNAGLFRRLEEQGCEVWPSPFFAQMTDLICAMNTPLQALRGDFRRAASSVLARTLAASSKLRLTRPLPARVKEIALEPDADRILALASPYLGQQTNYLIMLSVAKIVDFLSRGADGAINAAGINCMVGTAIDSAVPAIRRDFDQAPVISLFYGAGDGLAQQLRLDTFVHQLPGRRHREPRTG